MLLEWVGAGALPRRQPGRGDGLEQPPSPSQTAPCWAACGFENPPDPGHRRRGGGRGVRPGARPAGLQEHEASVRSIVREFERRRTRPARSARRAADAVPAPGRGGRRPGARRRGCGARGPGHDDGGGTTGTRGATAWTSTCSRARSRPGGGGPLQARRPPSRPALLRDRPAAAHGTATGCASRRTRPPGYSWYEEAAGLPIADALVRWLAHG